MKELMFIESASNMTKGNLYKVLSIREEPIYHDRDMSMVTILDNVGDQRSFYRYRFAERVIEWKQFKSNLP